MRDVTLIAMGDTGLRFQSLLSGAIEAAILTPPYTVMAEQKGLNNLVWLGDIVGDVPSNGLSTTVRKLKENPDQVQREHKQEALPILAKEFPGMDRNTRAETLDFYLKAMSPDGRVSDNVVREMINEQRALLNVKNEVPITQGRLRPAATHR